MKKAILIYNPLSGDRSVPSKLDYIVERFMEHNMLIQPYRLDNDMDEKLPSVLSRMKPSCVVASGGDGTINSVVNAMLKNNINAPVGVIPSGTCNDFARSIGMPLDIKKNLDIILDGNMIEIDVGIVNNERYFVNSCAGGIFIDASLNTSNELKKNLGALAYYIKAIEEITNIKSVRLSIETDTEKIEQDFLLFLILNGRHAAGFSNIVEEADIADGLMDIILIKNCLPIDLAGLFFKVLNNEFISDRNVIWLRTKYCTIDCIDKIALAVDGERMDGLPFAVRFINKALKVFVK